MDVQRIPSQEPSLGNSKQSGVSRDRVDSPVSFQEVLRTQSGYTPSLRFSAHAQQRMQSGGVKLDGESMARLEKAVSAADKRGAKDALVLMDDLALLVSISNRTVITAVDQTRQKNGVFTNIDSVVMA